MLTLAHIFHYLIRCIVLLIKILFFKQKTAYVMRISDWSSDVCSSDLHNDKDDGSEARADDGDGGKAEDDDGKGAHRIEEEHDRIVEPARPKARGKTERQAERKCRADRCQRHQERDPSPDQDPREDIAAELVGAQEVIEGGRREARADHDADRIIGSQPRRQDDRQNDENDGAEAEEPERVGQQQAKGDLEGAGQPRLGDGCGLGRRHHSFSLMRGSSAALTRSAMVVETTNKTVVISTPPMTTG